jgi:hypothetical protein
MVLQQVYATNSLRGGFFSYVHITPTYILDLLKVDIMHISGIAPQQEVPRSPSPQERQTALDPSSLPSNRMPAAMGRSTGLRLNKEYKESQKGQEEGPDAAYFDGAHSPAFLGSAHLLMNSEVGNKKVASDPSTSAETFATLAGDKNVHVRKAVARHSNTSAETLNTLAGIVTNDESTYVRREVARNPNTPAAALTKMHDDKDKDVRLGVASHPNTPAAALNTMAGDDEPKIRSWVARHPNTPAATLNTMAGDDEPNVRLGVASHPNTPAATLNTMASNKSEEYAYVMLAVASNPTFLAANGARNTDMNLN